MSARRRRALEMSTSPRTRTTQPSSTGSTSTRASSVIRSLRSQPPAHPHLCSIRPAVDLDGVHELPDQWEPVASAPRRRRPPAARVPNHHLDVLIAEGELDLQDVLSRRVRMLDRIGAGLAAGHQDLVALLAPGVDLPEPPPERVAEWSQGPRLCRDT